jgi:hypothetical protein
MARPGRFWLVTVAVRTLAAGAVTGALLAATAAPAHADNGLTCRDTLTQWPGGFSAELAVRSPLARHDGADPGHGWTAAARSTVDVAVRPPRGSR